MRSEPITREVELRKSTKRIAVETEIKNLQNAVHSKGGDVVTSWSCSPKLLTIDNYHPVIRWLQLRKVDWWIKCCRCLVGRLRLWGEAVDTSKAQTQKTKNNRTTTKCSLRVTLDIGLGVRGGEDDDSEHVKLMNWFTRIHTWYCSSQRCLLTVTVCCSQVSTSGASSFIQSSSFAGPELIFLPVLYVTGNTRVLHSGSHC